MERGGRSNNSSSNLATRNMHTAALVTRLSCTRISNGEYCILLRTCTCTRLNVLVLVLYAACDYGTWINRKCQRLKTIVLMYPLWFDGETTCFRLSSHCCWELAKYRENTLAIIFDGLNCSIPPIGRGSVLSIGWFDKYKIRFEIVIPLKRKGNKK